MHPTVDIENKNVLIIGCPASGKSHVANLLHKDNPGHVLIHTDDYIRYGYKQALYEILKDIKKVKAPTIVEGVQGYRLLRKGVELDCYYPDIVIELKITEARMYKTYREQRAQKDLDYLRSFNKMHAKILADYKAMVNTHPPQWNKLKNDY